MQQLPEEVKILFHWIPTEADRVAAHGYCFEEYAVVEDRAAACGMTLYAKVQGNWIGNLFDLKPLVVEMLKRLTRTDEGKSK